ncbi:MAG TPA: hypothetical protein VGK73_32520 [Polyangiaceae bacterium]
MNAPARSRSKGVRTLTPWGSWNGVPADALLPYPVAQDIKDRSVFWYLRRCPVCQQAKPMRSFRRSCSNNCKGVLIAITRSTEHTAKMQAVAHANTSKRAEQRDLDALFARHPAVEREVIVQCYRDGRRRGYRLGETRGICRERRRWENGL